MNRKQELKENMQRLISITESCSELSSQLSELRKEKNDIEEQTLEILKDMNMQDSTLKLNNYKIQPKKSIQYQALSLKYIQNSLSEYFEKDDVDNIINILKTNREKKDKTEIKLYSIE